MKLLKLDKTLGVTLVVAMAFFMQGLDITAVNTALPSMAVSFGTTVLRLNLGITAYLIALTVFMPISGWLANRIGVKKVFIASVVLFVIASALCGFSKTLPEFIVHRIFQGIGGSMMTPIGRLIVLRTAAKDKLVTAMAYVTWPALLAPIIGPVVGGYFATYWTWHWIFFLNIPVGIICAIFALKNISEEKEEDPKKKFDFVGYLLNGIGFTGVMIALELLSHKSVSYFVPALVALISISLIFMNVRYSRRLTDPLIDYSVLKEPTFRVSIFSGTITQVVIGVAPYLIPLMFQTAFGFSAFKSGLLFLASMVGNLAMKPASIWIIRRFKFRSIFVVNVCFIALTALATSFILPSTSVIFIVLVMFLSGISWSVQFSAISTIAFADFEGERMSAANTLFSMVQQMCWGVGIAIGGVLLHIADVLHGNTETFTTSEFHLCFQILAVGVLFSLWGFARLAPDAGDAVRSRPKNEELSAVEKNNIG